MTRTEALEIAWPALRDLVLHDNPAHTNTPVAYAADIWGHATDEQVEAIRFLESNGAPLTDWETELAEGD